MNQNELRIGNLVTVNNPEFHPKLKGVVLEVTSIHESGNREGYTHGVGLRHVNQIPNRYYETYSQFVRFVEPILLTAELALGLGFKRFESDGVVGFDTFEPEEKTIWYEIGKFTLVQWGENTEFYFSDNNLRIPVKYVHKLQNLYFEHTGVELQLSST